MSGFDVHTDKAIKELRARLDQAERERDEARQHARAAERDAVEAERVAQAVEAEQARIIQAVVRASFGFSATVWLVRGLLSCSNDHARDVVNACGSRGASEAQVAAAIRTARGAL